MEDEPFLKPSHRDDIDPELLTAIEAQFPDMKVVFMGDKPTDNHYPRAFRRRWKNSISNTWNPL